MIKNILFDMGGVIFRQNSEEAFRRFREAGVNTDEYMGEYGQKGFFLDVGESLAELEQKSSKHIRFTLSDTAQAARILERNFHENHFSIQDDHNLRLHNLDLPVGKIVTAFVENGLEVSEAHTCEESLEDYFKRVTGGEGIA